MLARNSLAYALARGVPALLNFAGLAVYTRLLSPESYGAYALCLALVSFFQLTFFGWVRQGILRFYGAAGTDRERVDLLTAALLGLLWSAGPASLVWLFMMAFAPIPGGSSGVLAGGLAFLLAQSLSELVLARDIAALSPLGYGLRSGLRAAACLVLSVLCLEVFHLGAEGIMLGLTLGALTIVMADLPSWMKGVHRSVHLVAQTRMMLKFGLPLTLGLVMTIVIGLSDRFLIGAMLGVHEVGQYAAGYDLANNGLMVLFNVLTLAAYPLAVHTLERQGPEAARVQLANTYVLIAALALPACVAVALLARPLAGVVLGVDFIVSASRVMPWVAAGGFFAGMTANYLNLAFLLGHKTWLQILPAAAGALGNVLLNVILLPRLGIMGAAYAMLASSALWFVCSALLSPRGFALPWPLGATARIAVATAAMAAVLARPVSESLTLGLMLQIMLAAAVYGGACWALNIGGTRDFARAALGRLAKDLEPLG